MRQLTPSLVIALFASACGPAEITPGSPGSESAFTAAGHQFNGKNLNGVSLNGKNLNGKNLNGVNLSGVNLSGVSVNGVALGDVSVDVKLVGDLLTATLPDGTTLSGAQLVGAIFGATDTDGVVYQLRLDGVEQAPLKLASPIAGARGTVGTNAIVGHFGRDVYWYTWSLRRLPLVLQGTLRPITNAWAPACPSVDRDGRTNLAIVSSGHWKDCAGADGCGGRDSDVGFNISCRDVGAVAKCIDRVGYEPWNTVTACNAHGTCQDVSLEPFLEACVRMIRADYCGDGTSHTQDGTQIDVYDGVGVQTRDPNETWWPEALWTPHGAACMSGYRIVDPDTGVPYGDVINGASCTHRPFVSESSAVTCAQPGSITWPGMWGGIIGDYSSKADL
jgi:hypothetical protein